MSTALEGVSHLDAAGGGMGTQKCALHLWIHQTVVFAQQAVTLSQHLAQTALLLSTSDQRCASKDTSNERGVEAVEELVF